MTERDDREAILYSFAVEEKHDRETLERYLGRYPDLAEDLIGLSSEIRLSRVLGAPSARTSVDTGWEGAWEQFLASSPQEPHKAVDENPFASFKGDAFVALAQALNVPRAFLTPLRDGLLSASSVPESFKLRLAHAMNASVDALNRHFGTSRPNLGGLSFKSDEKPSQQRQMTFRELVEGTAMTDEQRQRLLRDCDSHGFD